MSGPWEKFKPEETGPWSSFQPQEASEPSGVLDTLASGVRGVALATDYVPGVARAATLGALASAIGEEKALGDQLKTATTNITSGEFAPSSGEYLRQMNVPAVRFSWARGAKEPIKVVPRTKTDPDDAFSMASDVAIDLLTGTTAAKMFNAARSATTPAAKKVAEYLSNKFGNFADTATIRHLRPTPKTAQRLGPEGLKQVAQEVRASGVMRPFQKVDTTSANLDTLLDEIGAVKGGIVESSGKTVNPHEVVKEIDNLITYYGQTAQGAESIVPMLEKKKAAFLRQYAQGDGLVTPSMSAKQLEVEKMAVQDAINYKADPKPMTQAQRDYAGVLQKSSEGLIEDPRFVRSKQAFGNIAEASDMANRTAGLTDGGGLMGHITDIGLSSSLADELLTLRPEAIATVAARGATKGRIASTVATGSDKLSSYLKGADLTKPFGQLETFSKNVIPAQSGLKSPERLRLVAEKEKQKQDEITRRPQSSNKSPKDVLERLARNPNSARFIGTMQKALERGEDSFGSTYFILMNNEPEFRKAMEEGE